MNSLAFHSVPYLIVGLLCLLIGYWYGSGQQPVVPSPVREFMDPDMLQTQVPQLRSTPTLRFIHTERVDTVTRVDTVRVPAGFDYVGLIEHRPLSVTPDRVYLNYFDPGSSQLTTDVYEVPERKWLVNYGLQGRVIPAQWDRISAGVFAALRYRNLSVMGEVDYVLEQNAIIPQIGVRVYL